jgi:hypothetical protein
MRVIFSDLSLSPHTFVDPTRTMKTHHIYRSLTFLTISSPHLHTTQCIFSTTRTVDIPLYHADYVYFICTFALARNEERSDIWSVILSVFESFSGPSTRAFWSSRSISWKCTMLLRRWTCVSCPRSFRHPLLCVVRFSESEVHCLRVLIGLALVFFSPIEL